MSSDEWSRVYDQSTESYYYWNILTYEVSWEEPLHWNAAEAAQRERKAAGLSIGDAPEGLAMLLATRKIQSIFRSRRARKILHSWSHVYDPNTESYYYWNTISYEVAWEPPPGYSIADANKRERDAAGLGIEQLPHGLGLLVATRKLQGAWRRKKARQKSREYNAARAAEGAPEGTYRKIQSVCSNLKLELKAFLYMYSHYFFPLLTSYMYFISYSFPSLFRWCMDSHG